MKHALLLAGAVALASGSATVAQPAGPTGPGQIAGPQAAPQAPGSDNLRRLGNMQSTTTPMELETVPQTGRRADQIRSNLKDIRLPPGFKIDLYAVVPDARHMAVGPNAGVVFVGTRKTKMWP